MPPARTVIRSNTGFSDPADLSLPVLKDLSVDNVDDFGSVLPDANVALVNHSF